MQVYLPDDLYELLKTRGLPASELLQDAVRAEIRRRDLLAETDHYLSRVVAETGVPTAADVAHASAVADRIERRRSRKTG
jgi:hypothetical protein